jgi:peptidyl-prolyl cis-trans isomerase C
MEDTLFMRKLQIVGLVCGLVGLAIVGSVQAQDATTVVAKVNNVEILQGDIDFIVATFVAPQMKAQGQEMSAEQKQMFEQRILEQLVSQEVLAQEAARLKVAVDPEQIKKEVASIKQSQPDVAEDKLTKLVATDMAARQTVQQEIIAKVAVTDAEVQDFFDKNPEQFAQPEQIQASHILIKVPEGAAQADKDAAKKKADDLLVRAQAGEDFAELAKANSDDGSKDQGGDLGFFGRGRMVPQFEEAAFALKDGEISAVVETQFGYHIIKRIASKPAGQMAFADVQEQLKKYLVQQKSSTEVNKWISDLRAKATIEILKPTPVPAEKPAAPAETPAEPANK